MQKVLYPFTLGHRKAIIMKHNLVLFHTTETTGPFEDLVELAEHGDRILLHNHIRGKWRPTRNGFLQEVDGKLLRNGDKDNVVCHLGDHYEWLPYKDSAIVYRQQGLFFNNTLLCQDDEFNGWNAEGDNYYIEQDEQIWLNKTTPLGPAVAAWLPYPGKDTVVMEDETTRNLMEGNAILYDGNYLGWEMCGCGPVISDHGELFFNCKRVYGDDWTDYCGCLHGIMIETESKQLILVIIKNKT